MNARNFEDMDELRKLVNRCRKELLCGRPVRFAYPAGCTKANWQVEEIRSAYDAWSGMHLRKANMYVISTCDRADGNVWRRRYIGEVMSKDFTGRICQHFVALGSGTWSKLEDVQKSVSGGLQIGLSFTMVEPEAVRLCVEEIVMALDRNESEKRLDWNIRGTNSFLRDNARKWMRRGRPHPSRQ